MQQPGSPTPHSVPDPSAMPPLRPAPPPPPLSPDAPTVTPTFPPGGPRPFGAIPGQPASPQPSTWQRLRGLPRLAQVLIASFAALTLLACSCYGCSGISGVIGAFGDGTAAIATPSATSNGNSGALAKHAATTPATTSALATSTPTPVATATPAPTATALPTATAKPQPQPTATPKPRPQPTPTPKPCAVNCNPWGYNFTCCNFIYSPPGTFCSYFRCISSFWKSTNGYVEECQDGDYSHSGGRSGSCSYHGGNWRPLLAP